MPGSCTGGGPTPCAPRGGGAGVGPQPRFTEGLRQKLRDTPGLKVPGLRPLLCVTRDGMSPSPCQGWAVWSAAPHGPGRTMLPKLLP